MMNVVIPYLGIIGAGLCILAYFLLERGVLGANDFCYYAMNGLGAFLVLGAAFYNFDSGDIGAIIQELCWIVISIMGFTKSLKTKSETKS